MLDQSISVALWGGRPPEQLEAALGVQSWSLDGAQREQTSVLRNRERSSN
jgi:hypothetical protein